MRAIIVCGLIGSGKSTVIGLLAKRLRLKVIDGGNEMQKVAREHGFAPTGKGWWETKDGQKFLKERTVDPKYDKELDRRVMHELEKGDAIASSRNLPWIMKDTVNVWLSASLKKRVGRVAVRDGISEEESEKEVKKREREEFDIYKKIYGIEYGKDLGPFQIVVETDGRAPEEIADIIVKKINAM